MEGSGSGEGDGDGMVTDGRISDVETCCMEAVVMKMAMEVMEGW